MLWDYQAALGVVEAMPRRRAYSESMPRRPRPQRHTSVSPSRRPGKDVLVSPTSSGYGSASLLCSGHLAAKPVSAEGSAADTPTGSPRELQLNIPNSGGSGQFLGVVVGSPLGSGPLNGSALPLLGLSSSLSSSPPVSSSDYLAPMRRPRLSSTSEAPTVASIPENLPLPDPPPRPNFDAFCSKDQQPDLEGVSTTIFARYRYCR